MLQFFYYPKERVFTKLELTFEVDGGLLEATASGCAATVWLTRYPGVRATKYWMRCLRKNWSENHSYDLQAKSRAWLPSSRLPLASANDIFQSPSWDTRCL